MSQNKGTLHLSKLRPTQPPTHPRQTLSHVTLDTRLAKVIRQCQPAASQAVSEVKSKLEEVILDLETR